MDTENAASTTTYYLDSVEYILRPNGGSEYKRYLGNAAIEIVRSNGTKKLSYLHQDHLGSLDVISNSQGQKTECLSFDAFGKRRQCSGWNPVTDAFAEISLGTILAITPRGFTGHEHIDHAEVIHMNGRIYDPINGRFMQADPIVQAPDHSQSPNRYSYVLNNPLSYTDPTGFEAYVLNPWSDWLPVNGDWLSTMYRLTPATTRLEMKKYKKLDGAYGNHTPVDSNTEDGAANKVDQQQTGPTELSEEHLALDSKNGKTWNESEVSKISDKYGSDSNHSALEAELFPAEELTASRGGRAGRHAGNPLQPMINGQVQMLINQIQSINPGYRYQTVRPTSGRGSQYNQGDISYLQGVLAGMRGPISWPANMGFQGPVSSTTLSRGTVIDRYGSGGGYFVSPAGTPFNQRSLPEFSRGLPYTRFEVLKPINVMSGSVAPAFGQTGGGVQYILPQRIGNLVNSGHLKVLGN